MTGNTAFSLCFGEGGGLTRQEVIDLIHQTVETPMHFKGLVGEGGDISDLPSPADKEGWTYMVNTDGYYIEGTTFAKKGDMFCSIGTKWVLIPSGDDAGMTFMGNVTPATLPAATASNKGHLYKIEQTDNYSLSPKAYYVQKNWHVLSKYLSADFSGDPVEEWGDGSYDYTEVDSTLMWSNNRRRIYAKETGWAIYSRNGSKIIDCPTSESNEYQMNLGDYITQEGTGEYCTKGDFLLSNGNNWLHLCTSKTYVDYIYGILDGSTPAAKANFASTAGTLDNDDVGDATHPIWFGRGTPQACDREIPAVANNLTTSTAGSALDARMGKKLNDEKLALSGGTMTGHINMGSKDITNVATITGRTNGVALSNVASISQNSTTQWLNIQCSALGVFTDVTGPTYAEVNAKKFNTQSSMKYKENIEDMTDEYAKKLLELRPVSYDYKNKEQGTNCYGLIAEEVAEIETFPVSYKDGEVEGLDYSAFVPQLIRMVQLQQAEIDELKKKLS